MQNTNNVYSWEVFDTFVRKACKHKPELKWESHPVLDAVASDLGTGDLQRPDKRGHPIEWESHPVLDAVAMDLHTGVLQRRDKLGHPIERWILPSGLAESYLLPAEVNPRPIMKTWLLEWTPEQESVLAPQEEVDKFGWLGALKLEEKRHRALLKAEGISFHKTQRAEHLRAYAVKHKILNSRGEIPSVGAIRNGVFYTAGA